MSSLRLDGTEVNAEFGGGGGGVKEDMCSRWHCARMHCMAAIDVRHAVAVAQEYTFQ